MINCFILLHLALTLFSHSHPPAPTPKKVHLISIHLPSHAYFETADQAVNMEMEYSGDTTLMKGMPKDKGPVKKKSMIHTETEIITGNVYNDSLYEQKTIFTKMTVLDSKAPISPGSVIYGTASIRGGMTIDSFSSQEMDPEIKAKILLFLQTMGQQISIPEHDFKIGESFSHRVPLKMPMPGSGLNIDLIITTTYKLTGILGEIAFFDITQQYSMNSESVALPITATGTGKGAIIYDIKNELMTKYEVSGSYILSMKTEDRSMKMTMESLTTRKSKIDE